MLCTVWGSAPDLSLGSCPAELGGRTGGWSLGHGSVWNSVCEAVVDTHLCERAGRQSPCPQRASCGTSPGPSAGKRPEFPQRGQHLRGKPWSALPSWKYTQEFRFSGSKKERKLLKKRWNSSYLEWVTKSYVGTSTTLPSTMSFKVLYINSLSKASEIQ